MSGSQSEFYWVHGDGVNIREDWFLALKHEGKFYFHNIEGGADASSWPSDKVQGPIHDLEPPEEDPS